MATSDMYAKSFATYKMKAKHIYVCIIRVKYL